MQNFKVISSSILTVTLSALINSGCQIARPGSQTTETSSNQTSTPAAASNTVGTAGKNFGGKLSFGIPFQPVTESEISDFWNSTSAKGTLEETLDREANKGKISQNISDITLKAIAHWLRTSSQYLKSACFAMDQEKLSKGELSFGTPLGVPNFDDPGQVFPYCEPGKLKFDQTTSMDVMELVSDKVTFGIPENSTISVDDSGESISILPFGPKKNQIQVTTRIFKDGAIRDFKAQTLTFVLFGNYLVPMHTWSISKVSAVPVLKIAKDVSGKFDPERSKFLDYGLIYLGKLPQKNLLLFNRTSKGGAEADLNGDRSKLGFLAPLFPDQIDKVIDYAAFMTAWRQGKITPDQNMEKIPVGSMHYIYGAIWGNNDRDLNSVTITQIESLKSLLDMYLNPTMEGGAVYINTLDAWDNQTSVSPDQIQAQLRKGNCNLQQQTNGIAGGMPFETEIVIGGKAGRALSFDRTKMEIFHCATLKTGSHAI